MQNLILCNIICYNYCYYIIIIIISSFYYYIIIINIAK